MRPNRRKKNFNEEIETKKMMYISLIVVIIAILTFVITYAIYSKILSNNTNESELALKITELSANNNEQISEASSLIGKNINEVKETEIQEEKTKIAINTSNMTNEKENIIEEQVNEEVIENKTEIKEDDNTKEEIKKELTFIKPVEGEILREFATESLVYSETLKEWITHNGIDIRADSKTIVKASEDGIIKSIKNDPRYGITVVIEHENNFTTIYSNLLTAEFVKEGEKVESGQTIGTVGNTAAFEISDDSHLHFEILKDNEYVNPNLYIK